MLKSTKVSKLVNIIVIFTFIFLVLTPTTISYAKDDQTLIVENEVSHNLQNSDIKKETTITNREFFDAFEESGYKVEDYLSEEEIEQALLEDEIYESAKESGINTAAINGRTGISTVNSNTYNLALNSAITQILIGAGAGAAGAALLKIPVIAAFISGNGISAGALTGALSAAVALISDSASNGVIIALRTGEMPPLKVLGVHSQ